MQEKVESRRDLLERYDNGEQLKPGQVAKIIDLLSPETAEAERESIRIHQGQFWKRWEGFRCAAPKRLKHFEHVVGLLPIKDQFAQFIGADRESIVVDLGSGPATMAPYLKGVKRYVAVDSNPKAVEDAKKRLNGNGAVVHHDLTDGLPKELEALISGADGNELVVISNWSHTYRDAARQVQTVQECLTLGKRLGLPVRFCVNMLSAGQFNTEELTRRFKKEIVPQNLRRLNITGLARAGLSLKQMRQFGNEVGDVSPLWTADELLEIYDQAGLKVTREDRTPLWGQCTFVEICK